MDLLTLKFNTRVFLRPCDLQVRNLGSTQQDILSYSAASEEGKLETRCLGSVELHAWDCLSQPRCPEPPGLPATLTLCATRSADR